MTGSDDDSKRPLIDTPSKVRGRSKRTRLGRRGSNIVPIDPDVDHLLDALKQIGDEILTEPTPQRLLDAIRNKKR